MPEMPEIQAHAERLTDQFAGRVLARFTPFNFTALKTAVPPPSDAYGHPLIEVDRRGKYLLARFEPVTFVIHLMQGGRLLADEKRSAKPRGGQARLSFEPIELADGSIDETALLLTEQGKERRAGVWCVPSGTVMTCTPARQARAGGGDDLRRRTRRAVRRELDAGARIPSRPADDRRHREALGERGVSPRSGLALRQHPQARYCRSRGRRRRHPLVHRRGSRVRTNPHGHELVEGSTRGDACSYR